MSILFDYIPVARVSKTAFALYADPCVVEVYVSLPMMKVH